MKLALDQRQSGRDFKAGKRPVFEQGKKLPRMAMIRLRRLRGPWEYVTMGSSRKVLRFAFLPDISAVYPLSIREYSALLPLRFPSILLKASNF